MKRRGMALPVAVFALAIIGVLVAMAFHAAHLEQRLGRNSVYSLQALEAAEAGAALALAEWETYPEINTLAVGGSVTLASTKLGNRAAFRVTIARRTEGLYFIRSQGMSLDAGSGVLAQQFVARLARRSSAGIAPLTQRSWVPGY